jgi:anti-sigma factor RsiW
MKPCLDRKKEIIDYVAGSLNRRKRVELERHRGSCPGCAAAIDRLRAHSAELDAAVGEMVRTDGPTADFEDRLFRAIDTLPEPRPRRWIATVAVPVAAAAVLIAAGLMAVWIGPGPGNGNGSGDLTVEMSEWRAPSDWLLMSIADELLESDTVIDEYYFSLTGETINGNGGES